MIELYAVYRDSREAPVQGVDPKPTFFNGFFFFLMKIWMALLLYIKAQNCRIMLKILQIYVYKAYKLMCQQVNFSIFLKLYNNK